MVNTVTMPTAYGASGRTYNDGTVPPGNMGAGGHEENFIPALADAVAVVGHSVTQADRAEAAALTALNAPGTVATSTTPQTWTGASVGTDFTWITQPDKTIVPGMDFKAARTSAAATQALYGVIRSYNPVSGSLVMRVLSVVGSGTSVSDWTLSLGLGAGIPTSRAITGGVLATGGGDLSEDRTITVNKATAAQIATGSADNVAVTPKGLKDSLAPVTLTDQATINWDMGLKETAKVTLGGNRILGKPTNYKRGETKYLEVWMDATGGRTLSLHACFEPGDLPPVVVTPGANKMTLITAYCFDDDATNPRFRYGYSLDAS